MNNLKPWFAEDIAKVLKGILFATREAPNPEYLKGFLACAMAICLALGIDFERLKSGR